MVRPVLTGLVVLLVAAGAGVAFDDPIAALNQAIQERFALVDGTFGLRRIVVIGDTPHQFRPEKVSELDAVEGLEQERLTVALYVAGRRVLDREPDLATKVPFALNHRVIFGPVGVTGLDALATLPAAVDLIDDSRIAFQALQQRDRYDFEVGGWTWTARAIRAASSACITCHQGRAIGDPLGVVLYAYRPRQ